MPPHRVLKVLGLPLHGHPDPGASDRMVEEEPLLELMLHLLVLGRRSPVYRLGSSWFGFSFNSGPGLAARPRSA